MKVSIVIPAYNEALYIEATVRAAQAQIYPDFEIIVVDNASSDATAERARALGVKVLSETRKGTQWARECGRKAATGEIIANLDADCLPNPDWLSRGVKWFDDSANVAVTGPYDYYDATPFFRHFSILVQKTFYYGANIFLQKINKGALAIGGNVLFRSNVLDRVGGYDTDITFYGDDTDMAKKMSKEGRVVCDRNLVVRTSARRLKQRGNLKMSVIYIYHFLRVIFREV